MGVLTVHVNYTEFTKQMLERLQQGDHEGAVQDIAAAICDMAFSLHRIANAQETLAAVAKLDVDKIVSDAVQAKLDDAINERLKKRTFIGQPNERK